MKISDVLTKDDSNLLRIAERVTRGDWRPIYSKYLEIFSTAAQGEPIKIKKANKGRFAANQYLVKQLKNYGVDNYRDFLDEYGNVKRRF